MTDLFTPIQLGRYNLSNRVVMAPMTRNRSPAGLPNDLNRLYYEQRASGGLIITEGVWPDPTGIGYIDVPGLHTDEQVAGWRSVTAAVHSHGGRIFAQIMHTGRISHPSFLGGQKPVAPSAVKPAGQSFTYSGPQDFVTPRTLDLGEIEMLIESYGRAAERAIDSGFDGVEIHGANGYLPHQFLATNTNLRTDGYGGSPEKRARFLLEVTAAAIAAVGEDRVGVRISPGNPYNDIVETDAPEVYSHLAEHLDALGIVYLHLIDSSPGYDVVDLLRGGYRGSLILNGGYDRERADGDVAAGRADLVSFGSTFLANPDLPERLRLNAPLNVPDPSTFYGGGAPGYTDYPTLAGSLTRAA